MKCGYIEFLLLGIRYRNWIVLLVLVVQKSYWKAIF